MLYARWVLNLPEKENQQKLYDLRNVSECQKMVAVPLSGAKEEKVNPKGCVEKATPRGGMNSRPYGRQLLIVHRVGHLALPKGFFNNP